MYKDKENIVKVKVIGVGGGGNNAAMRIINDGVQNIETYLLNTETGTLKRANTRNVLQIGKQTTNGLGAGANEIIGEKAALESREQIRKILENTDMLFLTAGMGGGTGTGAIPVIAKIPMPFNLEEPNREGMENHLNEKDIKAKEHLEEMSEITRQLSYNDINLLKNAGKKQKSQKLKNRDEGQREIQD